MNKGKRDSWTVRNGIGASASSAGLCRCFVPNPFITVRKNGRISLSGAPTPPRSRMSRLGSGEHNVHSQSISQVMEMEPRLSDEDVDKHRGERTASPERQYNECEGWCREYMQRKGSLPHADVVCLVS